MMKRYALINTLDGRLLKRPLPPGEASFEFEGVTGRYHAPLQMRPMESGQKGFWRKTELYASYIEGYPRPLMMIGQEERPDAFTAADYKAIWGDPIVNWLARAQAKAQDLLLWLYIAAGGAAGAMVLAGYCAWTLHIMASQPVHK